MPSKSKKQARFMRAVAHGWEPDRVQGPPRNVAEEFVRADQARSHKRAIEEHVEAKLKKRFSRSRS